MTSLAGKPPFSLSRAAVYATLIVACALVMIPFGAMLGTLWRGLRRRALIGP